MQQFVSLYSVTSLFLLLGYVIRRIEPHDAPDVSRQLKNVYLCCIPIVRIMEKERKLTYKTPITEVVDLKARGILCLSGEFDGFGLEEIW